MRHPPGGVWGDAGARGDDDAMIIVTRTRALTVPVPRTVKRHDDHGGIMTDRTYRVTEIVGTSTEGLEPAISNALRRAAQTLRHLDWFEVTQIRGQIEDGQVAHYQVGLKVGFRLEDA
jgi:dodecin